MKNSHVGLTAPVGAIVRRRKTWRPGFKRRTNGDLQGRKRRLSSLHSKLEPDTLEEKVNLARRLVVRFFGCLPIRPLGVVAFVGGGSGGLNDRLLQDRPFKPPAALATPISRACGSPLPSALPTIGSPSRLNAIFVPSGDTSGSLASGRVEEGNRGPAVDADAVNVERAAQRSGRRDLHEGDRATIRRDARPVGELIVFVGDAGRGGQGQPGKRRRDLANVVVAGLGTDHDGLAIRGELGRSLLVSARRRGGAARRRPIPSSRCPARS